MAILNTLLWAFIGLLLTIAGTLLEVFIATPTGSWGAHAIQVQTLGIKYQIGAVLLVGCLGGKNAAAISQIAYILLGLAGFRIFDQGGGLSYLTEPTFGYLLGFIPGAWICGYLAFKAAPRLESLLFSCICGLLSIHLFGSLYLVLTGALGWFTKPGLPLVEAIMRYSLYPLPGQFALICAVTVIAFILRHVMFY